VKIIYIPKLVPTTFQLLSTNYSFKMAEIAIAPESTAPVINPLSNNISLKPTKSASTKKKPKKECKFDCEFKSFGCDRAPYTSRGVCLDKHQEECAKKYNQPYKRFTDNSQKRRASRVKDGSAKSKIKPQSTKRTLKHPDQEGSSSDSDSNSEASDSDQSSTSSKFTELSEVLDKGKVLVKFQPAAVNTNLCTENETKKESPAYSPSSNQNWSVSMLLISPQNSPHSSDARVEERVVVPQLSLVDINKLRENATATVELLAAQNTPIDQTINLSILLDKQETIHGYLMEETMYLAKEYIKDSGLITQLNKEFSNIVQNLLS